MACINQTISSLEVDYYTPVGLYLALVGEGKGILLESAEIDGRLGRYSFIAWDFMLELVCDSGNMKVVANNEIFNELKHLDGNSYIDAFRKIIRNISFISDNEVEIKKLPKIVRSFIGYFGYENISFFHHKLSKKISKDDAESHLVIPGKILVYDHLYGNATIISNDQKFDTNIAELVKKDNINFKQKPFEIGDIKASPDKEKFIENVNLTRHEIHRGEFMQAVISTKFSTDFEGDSFSIYRKLKKYNPSPFMFYMNFSEIILVGASPEILCENKNGKLFLRPIAGTMPRGASIEEDEDYAKKLKNDEKERAEHVMLVDLGRNDLTKIAQKTSVEVKKFMQVERFSHVMHLTSYIEADLSDDPNIDAVDILAATFPAGTLSGSPKVRVMEFICDIEKQRRGPYGGAVGWVCIDDKDISMAIIIRTLWIKDGKLEFQAGAGIVYDSEPEKEWQECLNKSAILRKVLSKS